MSKTMAYIATLALTQYYNKKNKTTTVLIAITHHSQTQIQDFGNTVDTSISIGTGQPGAIKLPVRITELCKPAKIQHWPKQLLSADFAVARRNSEKNTTCVLKTDITSMTDVKNKYIKICQQTIGSCFLCWS